MASLASRSEPTPRWRAALGALLAIGASGLALLAQQRFWQDPIQVGTGLFATAAAVALICLASWLSRDQAADLLDLPPPAAWQLRGWRGGLLLLAGALSALILWLLAALPRDASFTWLLLPWSAAIAAAVIATAAPPTRPDPPERWMGQPERLALAAITGLALALRLWNLDHIPRVLGGDEAEQGLEAVRVLTGALSNPFSTGWLGVPTMSFYLNAVSIGALGQSVSALRLPWAIIGAATVPLTALLVRRLHGPALGLLTALGLALYHYEIHFSRLGSNQIADPLFIALALLLFYRGYQTGSRTAWALCGVTIGVAQYFYAGARFTGVVVFALLLFHTLRDGRAFWRSHGLGVLALLLALLVSAAPMIQYAVRFPNDYNARLGMVGVLNAEYMDKETVFRQQSVAQIMLTQFERALLAYNAYPDRTSWYAWPEPLLGFWDGALFILGLGLGTLGLWDRRLAPLTAWWWGGMLLGGVLTENPPSVQRLVTTGVPAVFFVVYGVYQLARLVLRPFVPRPAVPTLVLATAAVSLLGFGGVRQYLRDYTPTTAYAGPNTQLTNALGNYARTELGPNGRLVLFGAPRVYANSGVVRYLAPTVETLDMPEPPTSPPEPDLVPPDKPTAFVFLPERRDELAAVQARYPGGTVTEHGRDDQGAPLFIAYRR